MPGTLTVAAKQLAAVETVPTAEAPAELVADKGYHSRDGLKALEDGPWTSRIAEPYRGDVLRWHGDHDARRAVYNSRPHLLPEVGRRLSGCRRSWSSVPSPVLAVTVQPDPLA
jgi:transposase